MVSKRKAFKAAFPHTIPVLAGYLGLGLAYGILMRVSGFNFIYSLIMSIVIYGGSLQYLGVSIMAAPFAPVATLVMSLMLHARHLFYGVSMLEKYKGIGAKKWYIAFALTDETFSINYSADIPKNVDKGWFYFFTSILDHSYWVIAATLGGILGSLVKFNTEGLDFVMTAMFTVILLEQILKHKKHFTEVIGLAAAIYCRLIFGSSSFMIPTMIAILALLVIFKKPIEKDESL